MEERIIEEQDELIEYNWKEKTILVVEDEEINYFYIRESLEETKVKLLYAENGFEAVDMCSKIPEIDLVLMDIKMPLMDGYEATSKIKQIRSNLPVIAQTACALSGERRRSMEAGCDDYLSKPLRPSLLIRTISKYLKDTDKSMS